MNRFWPRPATDGAETYPCVQSSDAGWHRPSGLGG